MGLWAFSARSSCSVSSTSGTAVRPREEDDILNSRHLENKLAGGKVTRARFGTGSDQPLVGDWDGDGRTDVGLRRARAATYVLRPASGAADVRIAFGAVEDRAVAGDWDGDGTTEIGLWRPSTSTFWLRRADGSVTKVPLGSVTELPVTGDWNGDGATDLGTGVGIAIFVLICTGGGLYTLGGVVYGFKRPNPWPQWFGFHEVFHSFTVIAFAAHYIGVSVATYSLR